MRDFSGTVIDDRYHLIDYSGSGSLGGVYRAMDTKLQRAVAVKYLASPLVSMNDLHLLAGFRGDYLAKVLDFDPFESGYYLVSPWLAGPTVTQMASAENSDRFQLALTLAEAVAFLHSRGGRHGRLHPRNVRFSSAEIAQAQLTLTDGNLPMVMLGDWPIEALPYLSPEHMLDRKVDQGSDVYALAALVFELITGQQAFPVHNVTDAVALHTAGQPRDWHAPGIHVPPSLDDAIRRALDKAPEQRGTVADLVAVLRTLVSPQTIVTGNAVASTLFAANIGTSAHAISQAATRPADQLRIRLRGDAAGEHAMTAQVIRVGRAADNDIILHDNDTAPYHVRLEQTHAGWNVIDLGHSAEVQLGHVGLVPNTAEPWLAGVPLEFGEYELSWRSGYDLLADDQVADSISFVSAETAAASENVEDIVVALAPTSVTLDPGDAATFYLSLTNREPIVAHCTLAQTGLSAEWVSFSDRALQLLPGQTGEVEITIDLSATPQSPAGAYPFALTLATSVAPEPVTIATCMVRIQSNANLETALQPTSVRSPGAVALSLRNEGNAPVHCVAVARDEADAVVFGGLPAKVSLDPYRSDRIQVSVAAKSRHFLGSVTVRPFTVSVTAEGSEPQIHIGLLEVRPYLPVWLVPMAMLAFVFSCAVIAILAMGWNTRQQTRALATEEAQLALEVAQAEAAANRPTATPGPFATSCADIVSLTKDDSVLEDGEYTIYLNGNAEQPLTVFCFAMAEGHPAEYLALPSDDAAQNYALTRADGEFYVGSDVVTSYEKVRFDPLSSTIVLTDTMFAISEGSIRHELGTDSAETITFTPFSTAASCRGGIFPGEANVTLTGLPLQIADDAQFALQGTDAVGEPPTISADRQSVMLVGGGRCGSLAPEAGLPLQYLATPVLIGDTQQ